MEDCVALDHVRIRDYIIAAWILFGVSGLLLVWQFVAYLTDSIPGHILPLVRLISGTEQQIPVAYDWTLKIGMLSLLAFLCSLAALVCGHIYLRHIAKVTGVGSTESQ
jgi:hypothetical protein